MKMEESLNYWKQKLEDASLRLELVTDHPRSAVPGFRQGVHSFIIPKDRVEKLRSLSTAEGVPLSILPLAAFMTLLFRYTGQENIVVGSLVGTSAQVNGTETILAFVHTLLFRSDFSENPGFRKILSQLHRTVAAAHENQRIASNTLIEELKQQLPLGQISLPRVMYLYQNESTIKPQQPAFIDWGENQAEAVDITFSMKEGEETLEGLLEYNANLFESDTIARMIGHFENILAAVVVQPNYPVENLPLITTTEENQILVEFNASKGDYPRNATIIQLFEEQVERAPDATALIFEDQRLTYRQLNQKSNRLAHYLQSLGVGTEVCVGICLERSMELLIGILGILKAGGAYVPLDPEHPAERLELMLADAGAPILITKRSLARISPEQGIQVICLDEDQLGGSETANVNPTLRTGADTLAYVIYTSGSTGRPKGVGCIHRSVINLLTDFENRQPVSDEGVCSWWTSIGFDVSVYEIFSALLYGRALLIVPQDIRLDSRRFFAYLQTNRVKSAYITPSQLNDLVDWLETSGRLQLERLLVGVEPIHEKLLARVAEAVPTVKIINGYGPTEATVCSTLFDLEPSRAQDRNTPIGRPVWNTQVYLLDLHGQPVPVGVPGELYIGGDGLARGYLNQPEATAKKFVPNPFSAKPGARLYRTGDMARFLPDGNIMFIGRIDDQVKIHGYRIELGEIEACLRTHPSVKEALTVVHEDKPGDKRLVAYVILRDAVKLSTAEWRQFLGKTLPVYMIPSAFVVIDDFPLTPNGKVDRKSLPVPNFDQPDLDSHYEAPRNRTEETIAKVWAKAFNLEKVGIHDNFFDLGGDSILSIHITSKTNEAGIYLAPHQVFAHPTIAELATIAEMAPDVQAEQDLVIGELPLTPVQNWFFEQNFPELHHWNQSFLIKVQEDLDPALLEKALQQLLVHHDVLRLRFLRAEGGWRQVMSTEVEAVSFSIVDLSTVDETSQRARLQSTVAELQSSLNLSEGPLIRAALIYTGPGGQGYLFITIHHLVVDGVSWRILLDHLDLLYQQLKRDEIARLPSKTTSYKQWAQRLTEFAQSDTLKQEMSYWLNRRDQRFTPLPADEPDGRDKNTEASARTVSMSLSIEETENLLREVPKAYQTQINDVLLTALTQVFSKWTGNPTVLINLEGHGREAIFDDVDLLRTVGWFTTIFPVSLSLEGMSTPEKMLKSIKEQLRRIPNRGIGHGLLRYLCADHEKANQLKALPEPEISFNYLGQFDQILSSRLKLTNEPCDPEHSLKSHRHHLIDITGITIDGRLQLDWRYSENVHRRATIETLAQGFMDALRDLIAHCQAPAASRYTPSDFPEANLSQDELDDLLNEIRALESED